MEEIIKKVKNLLTKSQDSACSPAEAATCVVMAQRLLAKHNLDMTDITAEDNQIVEDSVNFGTKSVSSFQALMAKDISQHFGCEVIISHKGGNQCIGVIGEKVKVSVFKDVLTFSYNAYQKSWKNYHSKMDISSTQKAQLRGSYMQGFINGIVDEIAKSESSTALVIRKSEELYSYLDNMTFGRARKVSVSSNKNSFAFGDGYIDGKYSYSNKNKVINE